MTIRWITSDLGTAAADQVRNVEGIHLVDVRDLVDKAGNNVDSVRDKIDDGARALSSGLKTIVCCDYGISRSNAIAAGILAVHAKVTLYEALRIVQERTGETEIKLEPLKIVQRAINAGHEGGARRPTKRSALITGGSGFVGTALSRKMTDFCSVIAPQKDQLDIERGSTQLSLLAAEARVDCIIHLANPRVYTSNAALGRSLTMLRNVLDYCVSADVSLIFPSGWEVYSGYQGALHADESVPLFPRGPYGEAKYLCELLIQHFRKTAGLRCAIVRSSPLYGEGSDRPKFIHNFLQKARRSETISTHRYINGSPSLDLLHVDDFADALVKVYSHRFLGTINVGTGVGTTTEAIAEWLVTETGSKSRITQTVIESGVANVTMNWGKAREALGWEPRIDLQAGLRQILSQDTKRGT